jgi:integrase
MSAAPLPRNANHPKKGSTIKVEPIRDLKAIKRIKKLYADNPRDLCLFTMGINTAYRANELLSLKINQVDYLVAGDRLEIKQTKTGKYRAITINQTVVNAIDTWLAAHPDKRPDAPLFISQKTGKALTVSAVNALLKRMCREVGLRGNYGSHTMRKTWGYQARILHNRPIPLLMAAFGHSTQAMTLEYLCIQDAEIENLYTMEL